MLQQKKSSLKEKQKTRNICCKELSEALQYENASLHFLQNKLITLYVGNIRRSPKETFRLMGKLLKVMIPERNLPTLNSKFKLSNKLKTLPISVPIRFCPFCGKQMRKNIFIG